jgi:hypothetical protein
MVGQVVKVLVVGSKETLMSEEVRSILLDFAGVTGDVHYGYTRAADSRTPWYPRGTAIRNDRQVSLVSMEELADAARELGIPVIEPALLGANLLLSGITEFSTLPMDARLVFSSGAVLSHLRENYPCTGPAKLLAAAYQNPELVSAFPKAAMRKRGLVASVELPGIISPGDTVEVAIS